MTGFSSDSDVRMLSVREKAKRLLMNNIYCRLLFPIIVFTVFRRHLHRRAMLQITLPFSILVSHLDYVHLILERNIVVSPICNVNYKQICVSLMFSYLALDRFVTFESAYKS